MYSKHRQKNGHTSPATWARLLVFLAVLLLSGAPGRAGGHTGAEGLRRGRTVTAQWLSQGRIKREAETLPQVEYPVRGEIALSSNDLQLVLQVERNHELLGPDFTETYYTDDGQPVTVTNRNYTYHCFYHGHVRGHPESWVAVSTCSGVRGLISLNSSNTYYLEPVSGVDPLHHSLLNAEELPINGGNCGHGHHTAQSIHFSELLRPFHLRVKRNTWGTTKYMELYIVADNTLFKRQNKDYEKTKARIMEIANYVDKFYRDLNIRVPLIGLEVWTERDQCIVTEEPNATLWSFLQWRQKLKSRKKHDNAQLLTGVIFKGTTIGMAPLEGMCSLENSGGINVDHSELSIGAAATMAHEIGHNFGMSHDHEGCCVEATAEQGGCVMAAATGWTSPHDPCYHLDGRPRHCLSEFINAAYGVPVNASHSLQEPDYDSNVTTLTDLHNPHNLTCWMAHRGTDIGEWELTVPLGRRFEITYISLQFCHQGEPSDPISISILKSMDYGRTWRPMQHYSSNCLGDFGLPSQTVAQTRHQETEPLCSDPRPLQKQRGGMVLAFSTLDGRPSSPDFDHSHALQDWVTATDIRVVFHQVSKVAKMGGLDRADESKWRDSQEDHREAGLLRWRAGHKGRAEDQVNKLNTDNALGFFNRETKHSRNKGEKVDKNERKGHGKGSGQDEDGHNVTSKERVDIFGIDTLPSSKKGGKGRGRGKKKENDHWLPCPNGGCNWTVDGRSRGNKGRDLRKRRNNNLNMRQSARNLQAAMPSVLIPPAHAPLALSDLQVGGRCKCNGHASRCRRDDAGRAVCVCEHHTAGPDCDVCEDFHFDRPWHRATPTHPNPCVACECNGHSNKCRFSMEIFQQSGRRSGGVCQKCRHHTAGRHCQYCQNGYTRDHSKPLDHRKACQPCHCHPLGAVGRWCNQTSGQCLCREGVTGARCNRCTAGYKQGKSPLRPCIRIQEVAPTPAYQPQYSIAEECVSYCQPSQVKVRMNLETYCLKDYVLKVQVRGMERSGPWWQFSISVQTVYRTGSTSRVRRGPHSLWVPDRDLGCGCPALHVGRTYLLIGAEEGERGWGPEESRLVADRSTLALQWREHWSPKLRGFRGHDKRGRCPAKSPNSQRREQTKPQAGYIPPHLLTEKDTDNVNTHSVKVDKTQTLAEPHTHPPTETSPSPFTRALVCSTPLPE